LNHHPVFGKILAGPKISAGLKNYENLKFENFHCFLAQPVKNRPDSSEDRILTGRASIFPEPEFFRRLVMPHNKRTFGTKADSPKARLGTPQHLVTFKSKIAESHSF
jgi:hypothetical protein